MSATNENYTRYIGYVNNKLTAMMKFAGPLLVGRSWRVVAAKTAGIIVFAQFKGRAGLVLANGGVVLRTLEGQLPGVA